MEYRGRNEVPWWVNAIYKVGVPTAIACYLIWFLTTKIQTNLEAVQNTVVQHMQDQRINYDNNKKTLQLLRVICAEGSRNVTERNACFQ